MENAEISGPEFQGHDDYTASGAGSGNRNNKLKTEMNANNNPLIRQQPEGSIDSNTNCAFNAYESVTSQYNTQDHMKEKNESLHGAERTTITMAVTADNIHTKNQTEADSPTFKSDLGKSIQKGETSIVKVVP